MTTFRNGPAKGSGDYIRRFPAPTFLRVVERKGQWKALDGHDDKPQPGESVSIYLLLEPGGKYLRKNEGWEGPEERLKPSQRGWFTSAIYELWEEEYPDEETLRSVIAWRQWCMENNPGK